MPRVHFVEKARKDNPVAKKGESYYWWQNYRSPKRYSKTRPRPSQTTGSGWLSNAYAIGEQIEDYEIETDDAGEMLWGEDQQGDAKDFIEERVQEIEEIRDEAEENRSNMPDALQDSETGELLQQRYDTCDDWCNELDNIDPSSFDTAQDFLDELQANGSYEGE